MPLETSQRMKEKETVEWGKARCRDVFNYFIQSEK